MTDPTPPQPALLRLNWESSLFEHLSVFQQLAATTPPVAPSLPAVLAAALPAFEAGFAYTASHWHGELTVTLHYQGAELGSSAPAPVTNYTETCARLLAGLLGIPLLEADVASEPELLQPASEFAGLAEACGLRVVEPQQPEAVPQEAAAEEATAAEPIDQGPGDDIRRALADDEKAAAVGMVKAMPTEHRKAFTRAFREVFSVPADAKQIVPFICELQHLQFIDRYTVEAAGGVAA